jgi:photosystem II stability/assembly factor-like uncharacterized protein
MGSIDTTLYIWGSKKPLMKKLYPLLALSLFLFNGQLSAQTKAAEAPKPEPIHAPETYQSFKFRSIGPAVTSGRVGDIAVNPNNFSQWYIAAASGGVWKTDNAGTTFYPIFDQQGSYSIGCITIDPSNPYTLWVGTGENNNQRSVAYGDGIYKSEDGGKSWKNMGLKKSEHIGKIIIDPKNSNNIFVAAYGPLWSTGGDRGIYRSNDGGKNWKQVLFVDENTGFNEVHFDPRDPNVLYACAHQRRRHEWTYISGGPGSAIYKSTDGGETWNKLSSGLPKSDMGRASLAVSPVNPDYVYAIIEGNEDEKGFYRSVNRGASWEKRSGHSTAGNYYIEIFADPVNADKVYSMDTWAMVTTDGGKNFKKVGEKNKHVDNHSLWINPKNTAHLLMGCDGGLYESFDGAATWNFKSNLPITQFYRVAVDNALPFYNVYGGTQDNNTLGGPSRTISASGITNADWFVTVGGDGFEPAIDPKDPNIVYSQWQYGGLVRYDKKTGEALDIKPQEKGDEPAYRFNWDAPLIISHAANTRLYFAAQKVFRSDDRGNTWKVISPDLSRGLDRNKLPVMDRVWGMDAIAKNQSTSIYGNITALAESFTDENLIVAGTDDGLIQVTTDGGKTWQKTEKFAGVPDRVLVQNVYTSKHNPAVLYAVLNNHRNGDFKPYVLKSSDKGKTWALIQGNLPERGSAYCLAEDPMMPGFLFVGTEFGFFFSKDEGKNWVKFSNGLPTIAVRDIAIQERENDIVIATFGRGFYVLDNYSTLREIKKEDLQLKAKIYPVADAKVFVPSQPYGHKGKSFQGESFFQTDNPGIGASITYYLKDDYKTIKEIRQEKEEERIKAKLPVYYPSKDSLRLEDNEEEPYLMLVIKDASGNVVRNLKQAAKKGLYRVLWNARYENHGPINFYKPDPDNPYESEDSGPLALPGKYSVSMMLYSSKGIEKLGEEISFNLVNLIQPSLPVDANGVMTFNKELTAFRNVVLGVNSYVKEMENRMKFIKAGMMQYGKGDVAMMEEIRKIEQDLIALNLVLSGDGSVARREFETRNSMIGSIENIAYNLWATTAQQPGTYVEKLNELKTNFNASYQQANSIRLSLEKLEQTLNKEKFPYTPGRFPEWKP